MSDESVRKLTASQQVVNDGIIRHRQEAFCLGYRQALGDVQSWLTMLPAAPGALLLEKLAENADRYDDAYKVAPQIEKGIAEAKAGQTVDLGDFSQHLDEKEPDVGDLRDAVDFLRLAYKTWFLDAYAGLTFRAAMQRIAADMQRCLDIADGKVKTQNPAESLEAEVLAEMEEADRYADMVNAPLGPETIEAIRVRIESGDFPVRKVAKRQQDPS